MRSLVVIGLGLTLSACSGSGQVPYVPRATPSPSPAAVPVLAPSSGPQTTGDLHGQSVTLDACDPVDATFTQAVADRAAQLLRTAGASATVTGCGATGTATVSVRADAGPREGRGFHIAEPPQADRTTHDLALDLLRTFPLLTHATAATYIGSNGLASADVPAVTVVCANARSTKDAVLLADAQWRDLAAQGVAEGVERWLSER